MDVFSDKAATATALSLCVSNNRRVIASPGSKKGNAILMNAQRALFGDLVVPWIVMIHEGVISAG